MNGTSPPGSGDTRDFSLVLGGPLYQMYLKTRMAAPPVDLLERRIVAFMIVTWLPLLILSFASGDAIRGLRVPFLADLEVHVRFLLALPLLIAAEKLVHEHLRRTMHRLLDGSVVAPEDRPRMDQIVASLLRLRNSAAIEVAVLVTALTLGYWFWRDNLSLNVDTWYARTGASGEHRLTPAGYWYAFVSLGLFRFILFRWYFRLAIWWVFLWRLSRLSLRLRPLHPDRTGGLGFLGESAFAFIPLLVAHTVFLSGALANQILYAGGKLPAFQVEILGVVVLLMVIVLAPLTFFVSPLVEARRAGRRAYGQLATRYVDEFQDKWLQPGSHNKEPLVGSADIQSLADLAGSYDVLREMRIVPLDRRVLTNLAVVIALPFAPLILTMIPIDKLIDGVVKKLI